MERELEFPVTICLGRGDGGDTTVELDVTDEEFGLLVKCCCEEEEIDGYEGLEGLCRRIQAEAAGESEFCEEDLREEEDGDEDDYGSAYDDASYMIDFPDEVYEAAEKRG